MKRLLLIQLIWILPFLFLGCAADSPQLRVEQLDNIVGLEWDVVDKAVIYEVQGQWLDTGWDILGITPNPGTLLADVPSGMVRFRVRAWTMNGPGETIGPSDWIYVPPIDYRKMS